MSKQARNPRSSRRPNKRRANNVDPANSAVYPTAPIADFSRSNRLESRITTVHQWASYGLVTSTSATTGLYAFSFLFSDLPDNANYSATYDQYRFVSSDVHILPVTQSQLPGASIAYAFCMVTNDYDDAVTPAGTSTLQSYANTTILAPGEKHVRRIKPHIALAATNSGGTTLGARNIPADWIDATNASVPHYGIKIAVSQNTSTNAVGWYVWIRHTVQLRLQR